MLLPGLCSPGYGPLCGIHPPSLGGVVLTLRGSELPVRQTGTAEMWETCPTSSYTCCFALLCLSPLSLRRTHGFCGPFTRWTHGDEQQSPHSRCLPATRLCFVSQVTKLQVAEGGSTNRVEMQVARMVALMVLAFLLTWLPYASMALAVVMDSTLYIDPITATIPVYLAKSSTVYNPIIYIFMNRQVISPVINAQGSWKGRSLKDENFRFVCLRVQFRGCAINTILCGRRPCVSDLQTSEGETTVASISKSQKISPKGSND